MTLRLATSIDSKQTEDISSAASIPLVLPSEYEGQSAESEQCQKLFGVPYLVDASRSRHEYCASSPTSSRMSCFDVQAVDERRDTFCIASSLRLPASEDKVKFELSCQLKDWDSPDMINATKIRNLHEYEHEAGPKEIFADSIRIIDPPSVMEKCVADPASHTIFVRREDGTNLWHSLLELFSFSLTIDALQLAKDATGHPFFSPALVDTTQVIILDDKERGPYLGLWHILAKKPILRISELASKNATCFSNVIIPLAGRSNTLWQSMRETMDCAQSKSLGVFVHRVLDFFRIAREREQADKITITYVDRRYSRKLEDQHDRLSKVKNKHRDLEIKMVDFASMPLRDQIITIRNTDILVGVHGAGLAHAMFLPPGSALVEIFPREYSEKGYRNLAKLRDLHYFSTHADELDDKKGGWQHADVKMDENKFVDLMEAAVLSVANRRLLNIEV